MYGRWGGGTRREGAAQIRGGLWDSVPTTAVTASVCTGLGPDPPATHTHHHTHHTQQQAPTHLDGAMGPRVSSKYKILPKVFGGHLWILFLWTSVESQIYYLSEL